MTTKKKALPQIQPFRPPDLMGATAVKEGNVTVIMPPATSRREDEDDDGELRKIERFVTRVNTRQTLAAEVDAIRAKLLQPTGAAAQPQQPPKKYLVDPKTGVISVSELEGELTYKDALIVSASIQSGSQGGKDSLIGLITALRDFEKTGTEKSIDELKKIFEKPKGEEKEAKKTFFVDDDGTIQYDLENGEVTLSEARAISASRRAVVPQNTITPERLELMKRDTRDELAGLVSKEIKELESRIAPKLQPKEEEERFTIDDHGKPQINPKAKLSIAEILAWQVMQERSNPLYKDGQGNILPLPQALELKRAEKEEERKDEMHDAKIKLLQEGRKELPALVEAFKGLRSPATESMKRGGWTPPTEAATAQAPQAPKTSCPVCSSEVPYTTIPSILTCSKCGSLNFVGSKEQLEDIRRQLGVRKEAPRETEKPPSAEQSTPSQPQDKSSPEDTSKAESSTLPNPS